MDGGRALTCLRLQGSSCVAMTTTNGLSLHELSDDQLVAGFERLSLSPDVFSHLGHLRVAWVYLQRLPSEEANERICQGIDAFATHLGASEKYNRTLTQALVKIMLARRAADPTLSFEAFLTENPELVRDASGLLSRHYSDERLTSERARREFVEPDREPLPGPYEPAR